VGVGLVGPGVLDGVGEGLRPLHNA
jgi:hypothetical protein